MEPSGPHQQGIPDNPTLLLQCRWYYSTSIKDECVVEYCRQFGQTSDTYPPWGHAGHCCAYATWLADAKVKFREGAQHKHQL